MLNEIDTTSKYDMKKSVSIQIKVLEEAKGFLYTTDKMILILSGDAKVKINKNEYKVKKDTLINVTPWTVLEIYEIKKPINYIILSYSRLHLTSILNSLINANTSLFEAIDKNEKISFDSKSAKGIVKLMLDIRNEMGDENILELSEYNEDKFTKLSVLLKIIELLIEISRNVADAEQKSEFSMGQTIIKYIYAHSSEKLTIMKLATIFFMSESTVRKYIEAFSSLTFNELLYKIRLQKTEELLLYTNLNLDEIAQIAGFVDGSHITKVWNMKKNMTPAVYRQLYRASFITSSEEDKYLAFEIINFVKKNYKDQIDIYMVAKKFGINEVKINKLLLLYVDRNFSSFLNYTRINKSCELLKTTDDSIIDICFKVGYNNVKTFNNNFVKYKQITPTEFKKMGAKNHETPILKA